MGCIGQVGPDAYNARRVAITAGLPKSTPAYTVNRLCGSGLQAIWSAAMEMRWNDLDVTARRWRRVDDPDAVLRLRRPQRLQARQPRAGRRHRDDADRPLPRHPHGRHRGERRHEVRRLAPGAGRVRRSSRSAGQPPTRRRRRSPRRSSRSRSVAASRSPSPRTSTPSPAPPWRPSPACGPRSPRTARSPPATPRASTTVPRPSCWPPRPPPPSAA